MGVCRFQWTFWNGAAWEWSSLKSAGGGECLGTAGKDFPCLLLARDRVANQGLPRKLFLGCVGLIWFGHLVLQQASRVQALCDLKVKKVKNRARVQRTMSCLKAKEE